MKVWYVLGIFAFVHLILKSLVESRHHHRHHNHKHSRHGGEIVEPEEIQEWPQKRLESDSDMLDKRRYRFKGTKSNGRQQPLSPNSLSVHKQTVDESGVENINPNTNTQPKAITIPDNSNDAQSKFRFYTSQDRCHVKSKWPPPESRSKSTIFYQFVRSVTSRSEPNIRSILN